MPTISLQFALPILVASLTILGSWMLAMSGSSYLQPVLVTVLGITAVVVNDLRGKFALDKFYGNLVALAAFAFAIAKMPKFSGDEMLLAMTDALIYLQLVVLFRHKQVHDYWLILPSNLLQVAVASALSLSYAFGFYLAIYAVLGIFTLGLFLILRERERYASPPQAAGRSEASAAPGRWPLLSQASSFRVQTSAGETRAGMGADFVRGMVRVVGWTFAITLLVFFAMPRIGQTSFRTGFGGVRIIGFSEEIALDKFGQVVERHDRVMRVLLSDPTTRQTITLLDPPLWQGGTLVTYDQGVWSRAAQHRHGGSPRRLAMRGSDGDFPGLTSQQITIEPTDSKVLWCIFPPVRPELSGNIEYHDRRDQLLHDRTLGQFRCELFTAAISNRRQLPLTPHRGELDEDDRRELLRLPDPVDGVDPLAELKNLAAQIVAEAPADDPVRRARMLSAYLSDPTRFKYTLTLPKRDSQIDPIEDFLTVHREGHCEYFASALALMLRAVGVPSRVVVGFKGGEIDAITTAYDVQDADAHSWVEAYIDEAQIPAELKSPALWRTVSDPNGAWLRLDPTPFVAAVDDSELNILAFMTRQVASYARAVWANYVVGLDSVRQREAIFDPIVQGLRALFKPETWRELAATITAGGQWLLDGLRQGNTQAWFQFLFLLSIALLLARVSGKLARRAGVAVRRWLDGRRLARPPGIEIPFFRQLEAILARAGHRRTPHQTPREYAFQVGGELSDRAETVAVASVPRKVVEAFYRVRYGGRPLDNDEAQSVEQALSQLELALRRRKGNGRR